MVSIRGLSSQECTLVFDPRAVELATFGAWNGPLVKKAPRELRIIVATLLLDAAAYLTSTILRCKASRRMGKLVLTLVDRERKCQRKTQYTVHQDGHVTLKGPKPAEIPMTRYQKESLMEKISEILAGIVEPISSEQEASQVKLSSSSFFS